MIQLLTGQPEWWMVDAEAVRAARGRGNQFPVSCICSKPGKSGQSMHISLNYRSRRADDRDHRNIGAGMDDIAFADILRWGQIPLLGKGASIGPRYCSNAMSEIVTYNLPINSRSYLPFRFRSLRAA